jgi:T-complex protein 1 subunit eta
LNFGVDVNSGGILDTFANFIWEPALVKCNAIAAACEATCLILSIDETVRNPRSEDAQGGGGRGGMGGRGGRGGGRGMRR